MGDSFSCRPEALPRLGAALWGLTGQVVTDHDLFWADQLLGEGGQDQLKQVLVQHGILQNGRLDAVRLATWLGHLAGGNGEPQLLWTLPASHPEAQSLGSSYRVSLTRLIEAAKSKLLIISPFLHDSGVKPIQDALLAALLRGVQVILVAHDLHEPSSMGSRAIEDLRRESQRAQVYFTAYAARPDSGFIHAKIVLQDDQAVAIGSANLTGPGYGYNFETGVLLGRVAVGEVRSVVEALLTTSLVELVFQIGMDN